MAQVTCQICGLSSHNLRPHFKGQSDGATCISSLEEYQVANPDAGLVSPEFEERMAALRGYNESALDRVKRLDRNVRGFDTKLLFGIEWGSDNLAYGFSDRVPGYVPEADPHFIFDKLTTKLILVALAYNRPGLIMGPTGCGKSEHVLQVAARLNYPVMRVNHNADMYSHDIVGKLDARNGETIFTQGPLPIAMERPMILLLDEWDALNPEIGFIYQSVLDKRPSGTLGDLILNQDGGRVLHSHPLFRIFATSNTNGMGDDTGLYQGTQAQNYAFINRFLMRVAMNYPSSEDEISILMGKSPGLINSEAEAFVDVANKARQRFTAGEISIPFSTRDLVSWSKLYPALGSPLDALTHSVLAAFPMVDAKTVYEIAQRVFGGPPDVTGRRRTVRAPMVDDEIPF